MKAALTVLLLLSPRPSQGYSSLLSLLAGNTAKPLPDQPREEHLYETRVAKNADIGEEEKTASLLDTLNLSYAGNLDISNAVGQARDITTSLAAAIGSIIDLKFVRSVVDIAVDRLQENERQGRAQQERKENIKKGITTVVGAALGEQECWERTACKLGEYSAILPGKDVLFILADRLASSSWVSTLNIVKDSATWEKNCDLFQCSVEPQ